MIDQRDTNDVPTMISEFRGSFLTALDFRHTELSIFSKLDIVRLTYFLTVTS